MLPGGRAPRRRGRFDEPGRRSHTLATICSRSWLWVTRVSAATTRRSVPDRASRVPKTATKPGGYQATSSYCLLDLLRVNVSAAANNHVLRAARYVQFAFGDIAKIARIQPAAVEHAARRRDIAVVARRRRWTSKFDAPCSRSDASRPASSTMRTSTVASGFPQPTNVSARVSLGSVGTALPFQKTPAAYPVEPYASTRGGNVTPSEFSASP